MIMCQCLPGAFRSIQSASGKIANHMKIQMIGFLSILAVLLGAQPASAQGSLPIALQQVSDQNGKPIVGALLYFYQVGTVATRQDSFQDTGLTNANQWPLPSDAYGRIPMFYVASGSIHVRLTDPGGLVIFDYPNMLVIGPAGAGGGGGSVDPTSIASTGDVKFRISAETLTGWVRMNGNTIGNAVSGATERANTDTQALFIYLWNLGPFPVSGGRGASGLADFNANKTITTIDMRGLAPHGLDTMGAAAPAGRLTGALFGPPYNGNSNTFASTGGEASHTITQAQLPAVSQTWTQTGGSGTANWTQTGTGTAVFHGNAGSGPLTDNAGTTINNPLAQNQFIAFGITIGGPINAGQASGGKVTITPTGSVDTVSVAGTVGITGVTVTGTVSGFGSGAAMNVMNPFILGTYYIKL
jgi:hypothetical protein